MSTQSTTVLDRILAETREEVERRKRDVPLEDLHPQRPDAGTQRVPSGAPAGAEAGPAPQERRRFRDALRRPGIGVIAEFKRRSPSAGALREAAEVNEIVRAYERGGAVAVSVLTEGPNFDGSLEDLRAARAVCALPILRKDFVIDPYQLHEARAAGADAVLLIVAALSSAELATLHDHARAIELEVLVEVHDGEELQRALGHGAEIVGINNRDLRDFSVDTERTARLMSRIPASVTVVSESGISTAGQLARLQQAGVHAVLVGETLMRSVDPAVAVRTLTAAADAEDAL